MNEKRNSSGRRAFDTAPAMNKFLTFMTAVAVVLCLAALYRSTSKCESKGGTLVRSVFWYTCIEAKR